jgi:hypothetical protein
LLKLSNQLAFPVLSTASKEQSESQLASNLAYLFSGVSSSFDVGMLSLKQSN